MSPSPTLSPFVQTPACLRVQEAVYIELSHLKEIFDDEKESDESTIEQTIVRTIINHAPVDAKRLSGLYAYILVLVEQSEQQILILHGLQNYESNHGALALLLRAKLKKLPTYKDKNMRILAGGEIEYERGLIHKWNLKSGCYSKGSDFDESLPNFNANKKMLWLPQRKYQSMIAADQYARFFSPSGGHKRQPPYSPPVTEILQPHLTSLNNS